jgi:hypothetical protein
MRKKTIVYPLMSVSGFKFNDYINNYSHVKHDIILSDYNDEISTDSYVFKSPPINVWVGKDKKIFSICCEIECYYESINIIGMNINKFKKIFNLIEDEKDKIFKPYIEKKKSGYRTETVYEFDKLGLQIWTYRNKIITVICSKYDEEN